MSMCDEDKSEKTAVSELFQPISGDLERQEGPIDIESFCTNCENNGTTTVFFTEIPFFGKVVVMAFNCDHCGFRNNEVQPASSVQEKGAIFTLKVEKSDPDILSRRIVKYDSAIFKIPELEFEIPANTQKGVLSTIEGIIRCASQNLKKLQEIRRRVDPEAAQKIDDFCLRLDSCADGKESFTVVLDDPSGNSMIEYAEDPTSDIYLTKQYYIRTKQQIKELGLLAAEEEHHASDARGLGVRDDIISEIGNSNFLNTYTPPEEVMVFPGKCLACHGDVETRMFPLHIPYFKEVIMMPNSCDICGYKNSELRPGGGISEKGCKITLSVETVEDLKRDIIKSFNCSLTIPELDLTLGAGTGFITTIEGIAARIKEELEKMCVFTTGDSVVGENNPRLDDIFETLISYKEGKQKWTLILIDPLNNSFIAPICANIKEDVRLIIEEYECNAEEEEEFGIDQLKANLENYDKTDITSE